MTAPTPPQNPFANVKAVEATVEAIAAKAPAAIATVKADVAVAKVDVAKAEIAVVAADTKLTAFIKNNAGKIAIGVLAAAALAVWKLI